MPFLGGRVKLGACGIAFSRRAGSTMLDRRFKLLLTVLVVVVLMVLWTTQETSRGKDNVSVPIRPLTDRLAPLFQYQKEKAPALVVKSQEMDMEYVRQHSPDRIRLPNEEEVKSMSEKEVNAIYHGYLDNLQALCHLSLRMGRLQENGGDGGYEVCDDAAYRPRTPCYAYSFGVDNDFSFDDDVARLYGCQVFSFDPSMHKASHRHSDKVTFYNIGLGGKGGKLQRTDTNWRTESFTDIKYLLGHQNITLDVVKIDIEGSEWISLADMAEAGELSRIRQLILEFHVFGASKKDGLVHRMLPVLRRIEDAGFKIFNTHVFSYAGIEVMKGFYPVKRTICYETSFVNTKLANVV